MPDPLSNHADLIGKMKQEAAQREANWDNTLQQNERKTRQKKALKKMLWGLFWGGAGVFWLNYELSMSRPHGLSVLMQFLLILIGVLGILTGVVQLYRAIDHGEIGWGFGLLWGVSSSISLLVGFVLGALALMIYVTATPAPTGSWRWVLIFSLLQAAIWLGPGTAQWLMLRKQLAGAGWWVAATVGGCVITVLLTALLGYGIETLDPTARGTIVDGFGGGAIVGAAQWLVLRRGVPRAGWWILASTLGFGGAMAGAAIDWYEMLAFFLGLIAYGAITGLAMVWLLRRSFSEV